MEWCRRKNDVLKRQIAFWMSVILLAMMVLPLLPDTLFMKSWAFGLAFVSSGQAGHPYLTGTVEGENRTSWFLCLNQGASAHSNYDYSKVNCDVNYSDGSEWEKQLFWAYIGAFGSADGDSTVDQYRGIASKDEARNVAWKQDVPAKVEYMAKDGFMGLEKIPSGCKSPSDIFTLVSTHGTPDTAMTMSSLQSSPGVMSAEKLYQMCGLDSWNTFCNYITLEPVNIPDGLNFLYQYTDDGIVYQITSAGGAIVAGVGDVIVKAKYDPSVFKVVNVTGRIEYFQCKVPGAQQLVRVNGHMEESYPEFYLTTGKSPGGGGDRINVTIYEHKETFESDYHVELYKYDYETGKPLKNSVWQVLEAFPDQAILADDEKAVGSIIEGNMREDPVTWQDWLVFETDMTTDSDGHISYSDTRYYDFDHKYCDGHPEPEDEKEEGDDGGEEDGGGEDGEDLHAKWEAAVEACSAEAEASNGNFHHWVGDRQLPDTYSEEECFLESGAKDARDAAYQTFIHLRYSYTFREEKARDGYILHGQNGHPDDVPIEIITTSSSQAEGKFEWTQCSNEEIQVSGYVRNLDSEEESRRAAVRRSEPELLTLYDAEPLTARQKIETFVRRLFGISNGNPGEEQVMIRVYAEDDLVQETATVTAKKSVIRKATDSDVISDDAETEEDRDDDEAVPLYEYHRSELSLLEDYPDLFDSEIAVYVSDEEDSSFSIDPDQAVLDSQSVVESGPSDQMLHAWKVYDHRVPGEIHFNKRDMDLYERETESYDSYGDTEGDGTLEGAVYGLFAAADIYGPDTQRGDDGSVLNGTTGIIFDANDLVSVAVTDEHGDGAFLAITQKPHSIYNYAAGEIQVSGKSYPGNLYNMDGFRKEYQDETTGRIYSDCLGNNGDYWIGRPLFLGNYYIRELTRAEGYELSITGRNRSVTNAEGEEHQNYGMTADCVTAPVGQAWIVEQLSNAVTFPETMSSYGGTENLLSVTVASNGTLDGYNVVFDGIPKGAEIYYDDIKVNQVAVEVYDGGSWEPTGDYRTADSMYQFKLDEDGNRILNPKAVSEQYQPYVAYAVEAKKLDSDGNVSPSDPAGYHNRYTETEFGYLKAAAEDMMRQMGIETPYVAGYSTEQNPVYDIAGNGSFGMPEVRITVENVTTNASLIQAILEYFLAERSFTYGSIQNIDIDGDTAVVTLAVGMNPKRNALYETDDQGDIIAGYLFKLNEANGRYVLRKYTGDSVQVSAVNGSAEKKLIQFLPDFEVDEDGTIRDKYVISDLDQYMHYEEGDTLYEYFTWEGDSLIGHHPLEETRFVAVYHEELQDEEDVRSSKVSQVSSKETVKDPKGSTYWYYEETAGQYILHVGEKDANLSGIRTASFTVALPSGSHTISQEEIDRIGENNVWGYQVGDSVSMAEYLIRFSGAGAGAFAVEDFDRNQTYIRNQRLIYNGSHDLAEDGNTKEAPNLLTERVISQKIKVVKTVHATGGIDQNSIGIRNFRFKAYLKSNLTSLYRDENGRVVWMKRDGTEDSAEEEISYHEIFPALVRKIWTKGQNEENSGYRMVLETTDQQVEDNDGTRIVSTYNYDKFFDALNTANHDKWDDAAPTYTSWQPIGNLAGTTVNRTENTIENARVSDAVRQFAIDWYLDKEIAERVQLFAGQETEKKAEKTPAYTDELYDEALHAAILQAEDYLKPFFQYDLDEIYAIRWDSDPDGGKDADLTTLSADRLFAGNDVVYSGYYYNHSKYLPYGTYVIVEQQPKYAGDEYTKNVNDLANKRYRMDKPKEVSVPEAYADYEGSQSSPELQNDYYVYDAAVQKNEMERKYRIRFQEEVMEVVQARNTEGDFVVYRYGTRGETGGYADAVSYFGGTRTDDNIPGTYYADHVKTMSGVQTAYDKKYASMLVPWSMKASDSEASEIRDAACETDGESSYKGFSYVKFCNRPYQAKLRLEKLDSETHENILHDDAVFAIYEAECEDNVDGSGRVRFYEEDTLVYGPKEFLTAMCASNIRPMTRKLTFWDRLTGKQYGPGNLYTGIVSAGTPVCLPENRVILGDRYGNQTAVFRSYSTIRDGLMASDQAEEEREYQLQVVGYLETPQPLGAGGYVILEEKPPEGYVRTAPVAVEVYSDKVTYYKEGNRDRRVLAACYEYDADLMTTNRNKPQDTVTAARINLENVPIQLTVRKEKEASRTTANTTEDKTVTYLVSGRVDGSYTQIGGDSGLVYAYENGKYLGYAWKKGTLEYLEARKNAGEDVDIVYDGTVFSGYGYVTRTLETADDENPYAAGALMTLFDAIPLERSGYGGDYEYTGVEIERNSSGNVTRMYVREGYTGEKIEFAAEKDDNGEEYEVTYPVGTDAYEQTITGEGKIWTAVTVPRHDTDILYYDLDGLDITSEDSMDGVTWNYVYDRNHNRISVKEAEAARLLGVRTDTEVSVYGFKDGTAYLEFAGGDFTQIRYSRIDKQIYVDDDTKIYHLDSDGNRDSLVDPHTGMAYVMEEASGEDGTAKAEETILVWPVNIRRDSFGNIIARDKITTYRTATIGENQENYREEEVIDVTNHSRQEIADEEKPSYVHTESGYITGRWRSDDGSGSHRGSTIQTNQEQQNMNGSILTNENNGSFEKSVNPVYDIHGLAKYYQNSGETYDKGTKLYDRNGDFVRYQFSDQLEAYNRAAYKMDDHEALYDGEEDTTLQRMKALYHRSGESYILENTWVTSDRSPNDPFDTGSTDGQADILKRVPAGSYIMEELLVPDGYVKGMPTGITVEETARMQSVSMVDHTIKLELAKVDGAEEPENGAIAEYSFRLVPGAVVALYKACRIYTSNTVKYPKGYYLAKTDQKPLVYRTTEDTAGQPKLVEALWTTGERPIYVEGIPVGDYILEELETPEGYVTSTPVEVEIRGTKEVQTFFMYDDHTKVEIRKYYEDAGKEKLLGGAKFALYDDQIMIDRWTTSDLEEYRAFIPEFEKLYQDYGAIADARVCWSLGDQEYEATCVSVEKNGIQGNFPQKAVLIYRTGSGSDIRITVYGEMMNRIGKSFTYEYQFDYHHLSLVHAQACSYLTLDGNRRFDYLPAGKIFRLVEESAPEGFAKCGDRNIQAENSHEVSLYSVENTEGKLLISKTLKNARGEVTGARLALYHAAEDGSLLQLPESLAETWISGKDGTYTEADKLNHRIPEGYEEGDLKPHEVQRLDDGIYWLVELQSPDYMNCFEPMRIEYHQRDEIRLIRSENAVTEGCLTIKKEDMEGRPLKGTVYRLAAFRKNDMTQPVFEKEYSGVESVLEVHGLPVGELAYRRAEQGKLPAGDPYIIPYIYQMKEITPPQRYRVNLKTYEWEFEASRNGISYAAGEKAQKMITVVDEKTRFAIGKQMMEKGKAESTYVSDARMAVYEVNGCDEDGNVDYDATKPYDTWITEDGQDHVIEGLIAGHTYVMVEEEAPDGYQKMTPMIFTVSSDGRNLSELQSEGARFIWKASDRDPLLVQLVRVKGRYIVSTEQILTDPDGTELTRWYADHTEHNVILPSETILEQPVTLIEKVHYSDGNDKTIKIETRRLIPDEHNICSIRSRTADTVILRIRDSQEHDRMIFEPERDAWEKTGSEDDDAMLFQKGEAYEVIETTRFSDGNEYMTLKAGLRFDDGSGKAQLTVVDQETRVALSKTKITGEQELPGCEMQLQDAEGNILETWISGQEPHILEGILTAGETYTLIEKKPASGYAYAESITFRVSEDGAENLIMMEDAETQAEVKKVSEDMQTLLSGALLQILDASGNVCESWVSSRAAYRLTGKLNAGEAYVLHEERAPAGYMPGEDMEFTMPQDDSLLTLTKVNFRIRPGHGSSGGNQPEPEKKIGWITAAYDTGLGGAGSQEWDGQTKRYYKLTLNKPLSNTGDSDLTELFLLLAALSLLLSVGIFWQIKMTKEGRFAIIDFVEKKKKGNGSHRTSENHNRNHEKGDDR